METVQALREHVESSQNFENASEFLNILNEASAYLQTQQGNNGIELIQCIDIEGKTLIYSFYGSRSKNLSELKYVLLYST
jgi:heme-degrading monooxygenase HmoA